MATAASQKRLRDNRRKAGLCIGCGNNPPATNRVRCEKCLGYFCNKQRSQQQRRTADDDRCSTCGKPPKPGFRQCRACHNRSKLIKETLRREVIQAYGGQCVCCGEKEIKFLQIDHVDGNGAAHRRQIGRSNLYRWLRNNHYPEGFQVLCASCNWAKGIYGVCPHQELEVRSA